MESGKDEDGGNDDCGMGGGGIELTSVGAEEKEVEVVSTDGFAACPLPLETAGDDTVFCNMGNPISVTPTPAPPVLRRGLLEVVLLNICGRRARDNELAVLPSGGWCCWKVSNSVRRLFKLRRYSCAMDALADGAACGCD